MRKSGTANVKVGSINTQAWVEFLRDVHPHGTAKHVARRTGTPVRTVEKWLDGSSLPSLPAGLVLVDVYGLEFLALFLPGSGWLAAAVRAERSAKIKGDMAKLTAELAMLDAGRDGATA